MSSEIICGQCPAVYRPDQIDAFLGGDRVGTLASVQRGKRAPRRQGGGSRFFRKAVGLGPESKPKPSGPDLRNLDRLRDYTFKCSEGHVVDGNPGSQFGLAVLGASGSSKSHMLPAIVREMETMSALRKLGVKLSPALYANPKLTADVTEVFRMGHRLHPTATGEMLGPFGYKLQVGHGDDNGGVPPQYSLLLFDIAGEDLGEVAKIAETAPYVVLCKALMVLIDPAEFLPTQFNAAPATPRAQINASSDVKAGIRVLADTLTEVWGVTFPRELSIPVCFVIAKADAVDWPGDFDWASQTTQVIGAVEGGTELTDALTAFSGATRNAFVDLGGELVVDEIEECFRPEMIRYVAASATSTMPTEAPDGEGREWVDDPEPNGVALGVLHLLDLAGVVSRPPVAAGSA